jgi:hypothetical protein
MLVNCKPYTQLRISVDSPPMLLLVLRGTVLYCPAFQGCHMSVRCIAESLTCLACVINTTFSEKIYSRWCCIDRLSWQGLTECGLCKSNPYCFSLAVRKGSGFCPDPKNRFLQKCSILPFGEGSSHLISSVHSDFVNGWRWVAIRANKAAH